jgi:hypothetical protein
LRHDCSLIHSADGILSELDLEEKEVRQVLQRYIETLEVPVRVVATPEQAERLARY